jgi:hypothetical protein
MADVCNSDVRGADVGNGEKPVITSRTAKGAAAAQVIMLLALQC